MGRGTTVIEAALAGRTPAGCDINPLSAMLAQPRLSPPTADEVAQQARRRSICRSAVVVSERARGRSITPTRSAKSARCANTCWRATARGSLDGVDRWIRMVAVNRLTGHSPGFFSVYTLPPNQATSVDAQAQDQRAPQAGAAAARRARADLRKDAIAPHRLRRRDARHAAAVGEPRGAADAPRATRRRSSRPTR